MAGGKNKRIISVRPGLLNHYLISKQLGVPDASKTLWNSAEDMHRDKQNFSSLLIIINVNGAEVAQLARLCHLSVWKGRWH